MLNLRPTSRAFLFTVGATVSSIYAQSTSGSADVTAGSSAPSWTDILSVVVDILNLVVVVILFGWSFRDRRNHARNEATTFWVQTLVLEPKREQLEDFFSETLSQLAQMRSAATLDASFTAQTEILRFKASLHALRADLVEPLTLVSSRFSQLEDVLNDFEDLVTEFLGIDRELITEFVVTEHERTARELRARFYTVLLKAQADATNVKPAN